MNKPGSEKSAGLLSLAWKSWGDLLRSQPVILEAYYRSAAKSLGSTVEDSSALSELRSRAADAGLELPPTQDSLADFERRVVFASRLASAWMAAWTSLLPLVTALLYGVYRLRSIGVWSLVSITSTLVVCVALFFAAQIAGLMIQGMLAGPTAALFNRLAGLK